LLLIVLVPVACLSFLLVHARPGLRIRTYFSNAQGLSPGARVRIDGVDVGSVSNIHVGSGSPGHAGQPVEVTILVTSPQSATIPNDATASLATDGVFGSTLVDIDTRAANGLPIDRDGVLKSVENNTSASHAAAAQLLETIGNAMLQQAEKLRENDQQKSPTARQKP